jgi:hypothetical protein
VEVGFEAEVPVDVPVDDGRTLEEQEISAIL